MLSEDETMGELTLKEKYERIAKLVIERNMGVKKGEQVVIRTWDHTLDAAGELYYAARSKGANPNIMLTAEDQYFRVLRELEPKALKVKNTLMLGIANHANVDIFLSGPRDPVQFQAVPYEKIRAMYDEETDKELEKIAKRRKVRSAFLNIGQATPERAKAYGIDYEPWRDAMLDALMVDPAVFAKNAKPLIASLKKGKELKIVSRNGSKLTVKLAGRDAVLDDGVLRPADVQKGDTFVHLPSGVVFFAPLEGSAKGKLLYDMPSASRGRLIRDIRLEIDNGKVVNVDARENKDELMASIGGDKELKKLELGYITVGVNPAAKPWFLDHQMAPGVVGVHFGVNKGFGGKIAKADSFMGWFSQYATIEVDGKKIVKKGKIAG